MRTFFSLVAAFLLIISISPATAGILFYDDCENNFSTSEWNPSGTAPSFTTSKHRAGNGSYKFTKPSGAERSELSLSAKTSPPINNFDLGREYWLGWSIYLPSDISFSSFFTNGQFHDTQKGDDCDVPGQHAPIGLDLDPHQGGYRFRVISRAESQECGDKNYENVHTSYSPLLKLGNWNDVVIHVKFNYRSSAITQVWINGDLVMNHTDTNAFNDPYGPFLKIGVYVGDADDRNTATVYFDEIRVGDANSSYNEVAPRGASTGSGTDEPIQLKPPVLQISATID